MGIPRGWRKTPQARPAGTYWSLQAGARGSDRVAIALGYVTDSAAERALRLIQREELELHGTTQYDRILRLYGTDKAAARAVLLADATEEQRQPEAFGLAAVGAHYPSMPLRAYFHEVYAPWRSKARPRSWRTESHDWIRILDAIGDTRLDDVDEYVVGDFLDGMTKLDGTPATWNMRRLARNHVAALLTYARRHRHREAPMPTWFRLEGSTERSHGEPEVLTREEVDALFGVCDERLRAIIGVGIGLGLRPSEIVALRWEDVDLEAKRVRVRGEKTEASDGVLPLLPIALAELARYHAHLRRPAAGLLFPNPKTGEQIRGIWTFRTALKGATTKAGITKRITPYTLRHTGATLLIEAGVPMHSVAKMLRHTNPKMLEKHYDHTGAVRAPGLDRAPDWSNRPPEE